MRFDIYGRFHVDVVREQGEWVVYKLDVGRRVRVRELAIPNELDETEIATYLDDLFHEMAAPGRSVRNIP